MTRAIVALGVATAGLLAAAWQRPPETPLGFTRARASFQAKVERRFLSLPSAGFIRDAHRVLTEQPHMAGTARDRELAEWTRDRFQNFGLEEVAITTHDVLLPWPLEVNVELTAPRRWRASMREEPVWGYAHTPPEPADETLPYHAYSASGDVTAPVVYAGNGTPEDYDWLTAQGIRRARQNRARALLGPLQLPRLQGAHRAAARRRWPPHLLGFLRPTTGQRRGRCIPKDRGGRTLIFSGGESSTTSWFRAIPYAGLASVTGAPRIAHRDAVSLPAIGAPLSFKDARVILESLDGPEVPREWRGAGTFTYRAGSGETIVRMRVKSDDRIRPVWTVTGLIRGSTRPDESSSSGITVMPGSTAASIRRADRPP